jgi:hypothetical protein
LEDAYFYIDHFKPNFKGYSLHEVDGVFGEKRRSVGGKTKIVPLEERTQVVRMMFMPPRGVVLDRQKNDETNRFLRFWTRDLEIYCVEGAHRTIIDSDKRIINHRFNSHELKHLDRINNWLQDVGLFMNGYVLYNLRNRIEQLVCMKSIKRAEAEIWIASFSNLPLNKFVYEPEKR